MEIRNFDVDRRVARSGMWERLAKATEYFSVRNHTLIRNDASAAESA